MGNECKRQRVRRAPCRWWPIGLFLLLLWQWVSPAGAVEPGRTSYTAEAVCAFRSIGATDPDPKTRNPDHMARHFVNPTWQGRFPGLGLAFEDAQVAMDGMNNGVFYYVNARTHHMDAMLSQALKAGTQQVVIMGAGFDSRAYRFHDAYPKVRFFEIDLPATSGDKQQRVEKIMGRRPEWVTFVAIDFNTQTLDEVLTQAGFATTQKTFYIWEGVTYFISGAAVDSTLRFIAEKSAPGSRIIFDYMLEDVVLGLDYSAYGARRTVYGVALRGEPYVFGIAPCRLEEFVNLRGLALLSDLGPTALTRRYLIRSNGETSGRISEFLRIVHLEVPMADTRECLRRAAEKRMAQAGSTSAEAALPRVTVPDGVRTFLRGFSRSMLENDADSLLDHFSDRFLYRGGRKQAAVSFLTRRTRHRPIQQYEIVLTRFEQNNDQASVDGYVIRKGYRVPLIVNNIVKEADGRWRWYGNQP